MSNNQPPKPEHPNLSWDDESEAILSHWYDLARIKLFLHEKSHNKFRILMFAFSIPTIVLSTLAGFTSMSLSNFQMTEQQTNLAQICIGAVNIGCGILQTLSSLFKYAELNEKHKSSMTLYNKLALNIEVELKLPRECRKPVEPFLKSCKQEFENLEEQSPLIPKDILKKFKKTVSVEVEDLPASISYKVERLVIVKAEKEHYPVSNPLSPKSIML